MDKDIAGCGQKACCMLAFGNKDNKKIEAVNSTNLFFAYALTFIIPIVIFIFTISIFSSFIPAISFICAIFATTAWYIFLFALNKKLSIHNKITKKI
jgi:hypothetical protein